VPSPVPLARRLSRERRAGREGEGVAQRSLRTCQTELDKVSHWRNAHEQQLAHEVAQEILHLSTLHTLMVCPRVPASPAYRACRRCVVHPSRP